jgi:hypothetical protein
MTDILIGTNPDNPAVVGSINIGATNEEKAKQLPQPSGYRICVRYLILKRNMTAESSKPIRLFILKSCSPLFFG